MNSAEKPILSGEGHDSTGRDIFFKKPTRKESDSLRKLEGKKSSAVIEEMCGTKSWTLPSAGCEYATAELLL